MSKWKEQWARAKGLYGTMCGVLSDKTVPYNIQNIIAALFAAFLLVSAAFMKVSPVEYTDLQYVQTMRVPLFLLVIVLLAAALIAASVFFKAERVMPPAVVIATTLFGSCLQQGGDRNIFIGIGSAILVYLSCVWMFRRFDKPFSLLKMNNKAAVLTVTAMFLVFTVYLSVMAVCRYYSFTYNTFDFGIFA